MTGRSARIVLTRRYAAPPERVFEACSRSDLLLRWLGPDGFEMLDVTSEFRVGGAFSFRMRKDGDVFAAEGTYTEIVTARRIALAWKWTQGSKQSPADGAISRVIYEFAPDAQGTLFTLTHEQLPDQAQADEHGQGWSQALAKLAALLEID